MSTQTTWFHDQHQARLAELIRRYGWSVQYVYGEGNSPSFAYTIGLFGLGHPELLIFGTPAETAAGILNDLGERIRNGAQLLDGELLRLDAWSHRILLRSVPNPGQILFWANRFYLRPAEASVPALQVIWDDTRGRFPWDEGYSAPSHLQPRPGTFRA